MIETAASATETDDSREAALSKHEYTLREVRAIHDPPLPDLMYRAQTVHREHHQPGEVQLCTLLSVKTGGCPEDCGYCPQSSKYDTGVDSGRMMKAPEVLEAAARAKAAGASRFCMGAAWREVKDGPAFDEVLQMVRGVRTLGLEACCTLGMLTDSQATRLAEAGLTAYNHNLDTSKTFYGKIISTRTFEDRLQTLSRVRKAGITVCSGGIIGMGESRRERAGLVAQLANLDPYPESVPINELVRVEGTPMAEEKPLDPLEFVRTIAVARITMPLARVRLSAGRQQMSEAVQALCFLAGANSVFYGEKLLTTGNPDVEKDRALFEKLGVTTAASQHI